MADANVWRVQDELIEQPSWGGRYIIDLKGLSEDLKWQGKKVGQSYELAASAKLVSTTDEGQVKSLADVIGTQTPLLIKLTQAKGNSFQVHLPEGKTLGHWEPKPEAWFYLAPGLYTFGLKAGTSFDAYSRILRTMDQDMERLSQEVLNGRRTVEDARQQAQERIKVLDPFAYVNLVEAQTDDIVDLTAGGIHHSWEEDNDRFPDGNLVYEVQLDVPDDRCSMRGFDKGKFLDDGRVRPTHVADYLATIEQDEAHNDLSEHIRKPQVFQDADGAKSESLFRTPYFQLDRITLTPGASLVQTLGGVYHHLFVHAGTAKIGDIVLEQGKSYVLPAETGEYTLTGSDKEAVLLKTYLPG